MAGLAAGVRRVQALATVGLCTGMRLDCAVQPSSLQSVPGSSPCALTSARVALQDKAYSGRPQLKAGQAFAGSHTLGSNLHCIRGGTTGAAGSLEDGKPHA